MSRPPSRPRKTPAVFDFDAEVPHVEGPRRIVLRLEVLPDEGRLLLYEVGTPRGVAYQTAPQKLFLALYGQRLESLPVA